MGEITLLEGDCLEVLPRLAAEAQQVDSVVSDPPYHLASIVKRFGAQGAAPAQFGTDGAYARASRGFMGQEWDGGDIAFRPETWRACYDVLKPGGHLMAFSATRTYHRMACAIEDAGFEIRDMLSWLYGSGFPKSHSVALDFETTLCVRVEVAPGKREWHYVSDDALMVREPPFRHPQANAWWEWGTALKPAHEPICFARKPLIGSVMQNVERFGTGAINIGASRIDAEKQTGWGGGAAGGRTWNESNSGLCKPGEARPAEGRWPANVLHDGSAEVLEVFAAYGETKSGALSAKQQARGGFTGKHTFGKGVENFDARDFAANAGSVARFFYSAKASAADRMGSEHPTVKPIDLMAYLVRMVTPPGGTVLDPFAGSGSTGMGAVREGFNAILIEKSPEYAADIRRRMEHITGADTPLFAAQSDAKIATPPLLAAMEG